MLKAVAIEIDDDLVEAVIRKYRLAGRSEAVHLALRSLLSESDGGHLGEEDEYDEFSDLDAWCRRPPSDTGKA
jgi:Arc/MetJ family transcription regulator